MLLLLGLQCAAYLFLFCRDESWNRPLSEDPQRPDQQIAYLKEVSGALRLEWQPYTCWKFQPFAGQFINVDADGQRRTWNAGSTNEHSTTPRLLMFGGSVLWGYGARDEHTIASELARRLAEQGEPSLKIENRGVPGYVLSQESIHLQSLLKAGAAPKLVLFFDGYNETLSAVVNGRPGVPIWDFHYREGPLAQVVHETAFFRTARALGLTRDSRGARNASALLDDSFARAVAAHYLAERRFVRDVSKAYGFLALFCWQPVLYAKNRRSQRENDALDRDRRLMIGSREFNVPPEDFRAFFHKVHREMARAGSTGDVVDLFSMFEDDPNERFIDACHLTEESNRLVAEKLAPIVTPLIHETNR